MKTTYSPFWAIMLFFIMVSIFDLGQTVQVHREKMQLMRQYTAALAMRPRAMAQLQWIQDMRRDLLRRAIRKRCAWSTSCICETP